MRVSDILRVKGGTLYTVSPDEPLTKAVDGAETQATQRFGVVTQ